MDPLTLHLHGTARLIAADGREIVLERRAAALCALVALEPGFPRARAADWLWPESPDPRRNLRQQLLRFKQQCGQAVLDGDTCLALAASVRLGPTDGELLRDLDFGDCTELAAWVAAHRQAAATRRQRALREEIAAAESAGDIDTALAAAVRRAAADPDDEPAARELMRLHYLRGEPAAGLAVFDRLCKRLAAAYGSEPAAATQDLADALRRSGSRTPALGRVPVPLPITLQRPPVMAGREREHAAALQAWDHGRAALLEGEAGIGKSRLVAELVAGKEVLKAAGRPGDSASPYATLARLLAPLLRAPEPALDAAARDALAHLTPLAPAAPSPAALRPGVLRGAVDLLLQAQGVGTVALDDLHFADAATLELVAGLATATEPARRWLFAQRPAEAPPAAVALRDALNESQRLEVITLAPLSLDAAATLVDALGIPGLDGARMSPALLRHTGGNPLYLLETLKQSLQDGSVARGSLPRPAAVGTLIERRLQRLSDPAMMLCRVAAIAGVDFSVELAEAVTGLPAVRLAGPWHELQEAQVLSGEAFAHDLVADAAVRSVPPVVARRVHAQCAAWLADQGVEPARVARHWRAGGDAVRAGHAYAAAARRAEAASRQQEEAALYAEAALAYTDAGLFDEAFDAHCDRARALTFTDFGEQALGELHRLMATACNDRQRMRAQLELVGLLTERGETADALAMGASLTALAQANGDRETEVRTACHVASALGRVGRSDEALQLLLPLRDWVDRQPNEVLRMLWHGDWAAALGNVGRLREAISAFDVARVAARRAARPGAEARLMLNAAVALRQSGQLDGALALARCGHAMLLPEAVDATHRGIARLVIARDECETGRYDSALAALEELVAQFEASRALFWTQAARMMLATVWLRLGQPARAVPLLRADEPGVPAWLRADRQLLRLDLAVQLEQPRPADALPAALALASEDAQRGPWLCVRALAHLPPDEALARAQTLATELGRTERHGVSMALEVQTARAALLAGDVDTAARTSARMLTRFGDGIAPDGVYRADAWWVAARALAAAGQHDDAARATAQGVQWLRERLPNVPPMFVDSFLHRNPVNRALLAASG